MIGTVTIVGTRQAAEFIAQLVREGVTFEADVDGETYTIRLTGGC